ncbi:BREX-2 system phosphatase PglZ [Alkalimarinus alittae]|uniref:BREX-2 system phosphatase PglZ n=1 Tax=Alkalimarinus alittae TaxID=2961619 RepID=A0ABY6N494_9ALTE|nr:BREX-2 system phosphatase PglZ [Alkalimarinus alittae]UZE96941.1 BREX-2 system phosphatase PglZ [Alkalimarinus alittae]
MQSAQASAVHAPMPITTQLQAIFLKDQQADCVAIVWPEELTNREMVATIDGRATRFVYCPSELAIREALVEHTKQRESDKNKERLVLLSKFDEVHLAKDVLARIWKNEPQRISPWKTLQQLIKVRDVDPRLTKKNGRWMAEALLNRFDKYHQQMTFGEVLDTESAWQALALGYLNYCEPVMDLQSLFQWSIQNDERALVNALPEDIKLNLGVWLNFGLPKLSELVHTILLGKQNESLLSIALACSVLYHEDIQKTSLIDLTALHTARGMFKSQFLGGSNFNESLLQTLGLEASLFANKVVTSTGYKPVNIALGEAEQILASIDIIDAIELSPVLPGSLNKRLDRFALSLEDALNDGETHKADCSFSYIKDHSFTKLDAKKELLRRASMALRLVRWLSSAEDALIDAASSINHYMREGCYSDWGRSLLWSGDVHEKLNQVYQRISEEAGKRREQQNKTFSSQLTPLSRGDTIDDRFIPVEQAIDRLVIPVADQSPVLLLVLDGMSEAVYRELTEDLLKHHWLEIREKSRQDECCLVSAFPTITKVSRCSLLSGRLASGVAVDEKLAFKEHPSLKKIASTKFPPTLFHKQDLQQTRSVALNNEVRAKLASTEHRVLAAVINAVDDHLSSGSQVSVAWTLDAIPLLRQVLEAAREAGRVVIFTSDHGHVLDHDSVYQQAQTENGERYQLSTGQPSEYEVAISGKRVVTETNSVVLPWSERLRYTKSKNMGYHGGGSLQEVVIPLGVYVSATDSDVIEGWSPVARNLPEWWYEELAVEENPPTVMSKPSENTRKSKKIKNAEAAAEVMDDMFGIPPEQDKVSTEINTSPWISDIFTSAVYQQAKQRVGRNAVKDEQLMALIELLSQQNGQAMEAAVLRHLSLPKIRLRGFLAGAQKLLNVDGYPILSVERDSQTIKLNLTDLKKQFEL